MGDGENDFAIPSITGKVTAQLGFDGPLAFQTQCALRKITDARFAKTFLQELVSDT